MARAAKMSIQGVEPKLSARLSARRGRFVIVDRNGRYILKPQVAPYPHVPENEDLTMRLAAAAGVETPVHALLLSRDATWTYCIRRFDRHGRAGKRAVEDFAQLAGKTRRTKYDFSMERLAEIVERYTTFPAVEKIELFRRTVVCFLTGNEDMHLKNFSLLVDGDRVRLSPAYDLINTTIALPGVEEELALPLNGKKRRLTRKDIVDYYGRERLGIAPAVRADVLSRIEHALPEWDELIAASFLPEDLRDAYRSVIEERRGRLGV